MPWIGGAAFAVVVGVWLLGVGALIIGTARHRPSIRRIGALLRGGAMAVGLPAASGVAVISAGLSLFPQAISLLFVVFGAILLAVSAVGYRLLRRAMDESSSDVPAR